MWNKKKGLSLAETHTEGKSVIACFGRSLQISAKAIFNTRTFRLLQSSLKLLRYGICARPVFKYYILQSLLRIHDGTPKTN